MTRADRIVRLLTTPLGARVMLPHYGSAFFELIDRPIDDRFNLDLANYTVSALAIWEPDCTLSKAYFLSRTTSLLTVAIDIDAPDLTGTLSIGIPL